MVLAPGYVEFNDYSHVGYVTYVAKCNFCPWSSRPRTANVAETKGIREVMEDKVWNHARQFHKIQLRKEYGSM